MAAHHASILSQASTFFREESYRKTSGFNVKNQIAWDGELYLDMALTGACFARVDAYWSRFWVHEDDITGSGKLHELYQGYYCHIFQKVRGRQPYSCDKILMFAARLIRKIKNPLDFKERLLHNPIYKSSSL